MEVELVAGLKTYNPLLAANFSWAKSQQQQFTSISFLSSTKINSAADNSKSKANELIDGMISEIN